MIEDKLLKIFESDPDGILDTPKRASRHASSDLLEQSFLEIEYFYNENGRKPDANSKVISERKLGRRLAGILLDEEKIAKLKHLDTNGILNIEAPETIEDILSSDNLGLLDDPTGILDTSRLPKTIKAADYRASQKKAADFKIYEPLFKEMHQRLATGKARRIKFVGEQSIQKGEYFILKGQMIYIAEKGELFTNENAKRDSRLRIIYDNGTESDPLMRTLARELYRNGTRITDGQLINENDHQTGYIYILQSLSDDPMIGNIPDLYKIGYTEGIVESRIANAEKESTYFMAPVKIIATYKTYNMNTHKFEDLLHRVFSEVNVDAVVKSNERYNRATEWYSVPLPVIDRAVELIISGDMTHYQYDVPTKSFKIR